MTFSELDVALTSDPYVNTYYSSALQNWLAYVYTSGECRKWWQINMIKGSIDHDDYAWIVDSMLGANCIDEDGHTALMAYQPA